MEEKTTIAVDRETQQLLRDYCFFNRIHISDFVREIAQEKLQDFKEKLDQIRGL